MAKLDIRTNSCVDHGAIVRNVRYTANLGLPRVVTKERPPLMVLGGGHSIRERLEEVRASSADKWIIGSAYKWWKDHGVDGTFFCVDPSPLLIPCVEGVSTALLEFSTDPGVFAALKGKDVTVFDRVADMECANGATSATCAPMLALKMGYLDVSFYGCEGSYKETTHLYMDTGDPWKMRVTCNGESFLTGAEFLLQSEFLAEVIRASHVFKDCSGGLLGAMVRDPDYDVTHISRALNDSLEVRVNG